MSELSDPYIVQYPRSLQSNYFFNFGYEVCKFLTKCNFGFVENHRITKFECTYTHRDRQTRHTYE